MIGIFCLIENIEEVPTSCINTQHMVFAIDVKVLFQEKLYKICFYIQSIHAFCIIKSAQNTTVLVQKLLNMNFKYYIVLDEHLDTGGVY